MNRKSLLSNEPYDLNSQSFNESKILLYNHNVWFIHIFLFYIK